MTETKKRIETDLVHSANYLVLGMWFVLRVLDYVFSFIAISLGFGYEANPLGFSLLLFIIGFGAIFGVMIMNYKFPERRDAMFVIFLGASIWTIIQTMVTLNSICGVIIRL